MSRIRFPRHDRAWWAATIATQPQSGLTNAAFAAKHGVHPDTVRWWRQKLSRPPAPDQPLAMVRVRVTPITVPPPARVEVAASIGPVSVRFDSGCDATFIGTVLGSAAKAAGLPC